ncbi:MAG: serine/threonine-protein phosphatase [Bacteroidales bacterium]|nr:serine/threonine-protein phosphatase [Bacteroidales bacterium]
MVDGSQTNISRLKFSNFKLKTLLDITEAIISNSTVDKLLAQYQDLLENQLNIHKILIYIFQADKWEIIIKTGVNPQDYQNIVPERDFRDISDITITYSSDLFRSFDYVIPVLKDGHPFAYVLIGDLDDVTEGMAPSIKHLNFVQTLSNIIIVSVENHRLMEENMRQERFKKELEMASRMQNMLIPKADLFCGDPNITVAPFYLPHYEVGGDYYDFDYLSSHEMFFCIADVSGKGMSAAILMSNFQASLKALFVPEMDLPTLVSRLNSIVVRNSDGDRFITLFIGRYDFDSHILRYINAGHNAPYLYNYNTGELQTLKKGCTGIGMLDEFIVPPQEGIVELHDNSKLICFTDGVVEMERDGIPDFGENVVQQCAASQSDVENTIKTLLQTLDIQRSNHSVRDDVTLLGIDFHINNQHQ